MSARLLAEVSRLRHTRAQRRVYRRRRRAVFGVAVAVVVASGLAITAFVGGLGASAPSTDADSPTEPPSTVMVYGDSILAQAADYLHERLPEKGWRVQHHAFGGLALCDFMESWFDADLAQDPALVIIATNGNSGLGGGCSKDRGSQQQVYEEDATAVAKYWQDHGAQVLWTDTPNTEEYGDHPLVKVLNGVAQRFGQGFVRATDALRGPYGKWSLRLPCSERERKEAHCDSDGTVQVRRTESNSHLCPVAYEGPGSCPVYSGGVVRWVDGIVAAARPMMEQIRAERRRQESS